MPSHKRPAKRNLVRWSDDLDKGVLLALQYASAESGIKLPWGRVAEIMGPKFTEGSIVQHLAKLRTIMANDNIPVPPPLRRGMVTKVPSKVYSNTGTKTKYEPVSPMYAGSPGPMADEVSIYGRSDGTPGEEAESTPKGKARAKLSRRKMSDDDEDEDEEQGLLPELYDSEDGYVPTRKTRKSRAQAKVKGERQDPPSTPTAQTIKAEQIDEPNLSAVNTETDPPIRRTRGIKRDYSAMEASLSEDEANNVQNDAGEHEEAEVAANYAEDDLPGEEQTEIADHDAGTTDDATASIGNTGSIANFTPQSPRVANVPYGQIHMVGPLAANVNAGQYHDNYLGSSFQGFPYGGNLVAGGLTSASTHSPFNGLPIMNSIPPPAYYGPGVAPSTVALSANSSYGSTRNNSVATSSYGSTRNNSVATGMSVSSLNGSASNDHTSDLGQIQPADDTGNFDMAANMPLDDIVWNDSLGHGYFEDDF